MNAAVNRRRFLQIAASAALFPAAAMSAEPVFRWRGTALGARASMVLAGVDVRRGEDVAERVQCELDRLEDIFSLYRVGSAINRLNGDGRLDEPPPELLEVLTLCASLAHATDGAFDPTVQPLWRLYFDCARQDREPSSAEIGRTRSLVGWRQLVYSPARVAFCRPKMAITLNGIAQGYIADRIAALLGAEGLADIVVDTGEIVANGNRPDGTPWRAGISDTDGRIVRRVRLSNRALATSSPLGTLLDRNRRIGHILNPGSGTAHTLWNLVSVSAPSAAIADGLSTAFCMMPRERIEAALAPYQGARIETLAAD